MQKALKKQAETNFLKKVLMTNVEPAAVLVRLEEIKRV